MQLVAGFSAYLHGVDYDVQHYKRELDRAVEHIRRQHAQQQKAA